MEPRGDEASQPLLRLGYPSPDCANAKGLSDSARLVLAPIAVEACEDLRAQELFDGSEDRSPGSKRQINHRLLIRRPVLADCGDHTAHARKPEPVGCEEAGPLSGSFQRVGLRFHPQAQLRFASNVELANAKMSTSILNTIRWTGARADSPYRSSVVAIDISS